MVEAAGSDSCRVGDDGAPTNQIKQMKTKLQSILRRGKPPGQLCTGISLDVAQGAALPLTLLAAPDALQVTAPLLHGLMVQPIDACCTHGVDEPVDIELTCVEHAVAAG